MFDHRKTICSFVILHITIRVNACACLHRFISTCHRATDRGASIAIFHKQGGSCVVCVINEFTARHRAQRTRCGLTPDRSLYAFATDSTQRIAPQRVLKDCYRGVLTPVAAPWPVDSQVVARRCSRAVAMRTSIVAAAASCSALTYRMRTTIRRSF